MSARIFVTWPRGPEEWEQRKHHHGNSHQASCMLRGLQARRENVEWVNWGSLPPAHIGPNDWLITHPDFFITGRGDNRELRAAFVEKGNVGLVMNDPLYNYAWEHGAYNHHGYNGFDNRGMNYHPDAPSPWRLGQLEQIKQARFTMCHSNPVVLKLWALDDPRVETAKTLTRGLNFHPVMAPCDLEALHREIHEPRNGRQVLTVPGRDPRKNQQAVANWRAESGRMNWFDPAFVGRVKATCSFAVSPSLQEAFPYFALESMAKGLGFMGGEDWWDGYGDELLIWRHGDPDNTHKLVILTDGGTQAQEAYDQLQHVFRSDPEVRWDTFMDRMDALMKENQK